MSSFDEIANQALLKIGCHPVSLDDKKSTEARALNEMLNPTRRKLLRLHNWHFALKRAPLQRIPEPYEFTEPNDYAWRHGMTPRHATCGPRFYEGYSPFVGVHKKAFALPADLLKLESILHPYRVPYELEGPNLRISAHQVTIRYVWDVDNPHLFDPLFQDCFATLLAAQLAYNLAGTESKGQALKQEFDILLRDAKRVDSQETHSKKFINEEELMLARLTGSYFESYP